MYPGHGGAGRVAGVAGQALAGGKAQVQHRGICRPRAGCSCERFAHARALHLMVVPADDILLAADIGCRQQRQERGRQVAARSGGQRGRVRFAGHGRGPDGLQVTPRDAVMEEMRVQPADDAATVAEADLPVAGERSQCGGFHVQPRADGLHARPVRGRYGQHHALLGLAEPDFPRLQPAIFEGHARQVHLRAQLRRHLAHGGGQSACAAVGDCGIQALIAGQEHGLQRLFLVNRMANLHRAARNLAGLVRHLHRGEGGSPQSVTTRPATDDDDQVARLGGRAV